MDDAELDFSNPEVFTVGGGDGDHRSTCSIDSFFDELPEVFGKDNAHQHACTHTHTCNPPGPDLSGHHTHTCFHVHTKILSSSPAAPSDETADSNSSSQKKRPCAGNREAVRKYREKKKARAASLEDEVAHLRALNQQLMKQLQGQSALEAEVARLRCLLVDIRGRIEGELGAFPYQKPVKNGDLMSDMMMGGGSGAHVVNPCNLRCDDNPLYCLQPGMQGKGGGEGGGGGLNGHQGFGACEIGSIECMGVSAMGPKEYFGCVTGNGMGAGCATGGNKMNGDHAAVEE